MGDRTHYLDRKPGKFGVTIQENPSKGKHGIGAILEKKHWRTTANGRNNTKINTFIQTATIKIRNDIFGAEFASIYGTDEINRKACAQLLLDGAGLCLATAGPPAGAIWVYNRLYKTLSKITFGITIFSEKKQISMRL
jgi:hypothetical protein